jgi:hypothetical protein
MNAYDAFFAENEVKIVLGRKKSKVQSIDDALTQFKEYCATSKITSEDKLKKNDGHLVVSGETIAVFSLEGRLWSTDEEEVIWR